MMEETPAVAAALTCFPPRTEEGQAVHGYHHPFTGGFQRGEGKRGGKGGRGGEIKRTHAPFPSCIAWGWGEKGGRSGRPGEEKKKGKGGEKEKGKEGEMPKFPSSSSS